MRRRLSSRSGRWPVKSPFALFAGGIIATGLLAVPMLASFAAYPVAEVFLAGVLHGDLNNDMKVEECGWSAPLRVGGKHYVWLRTPRQAPVRPNARNRCAKVNGLSGLIRKTFVAAATDDLQVAHQALFLL